MQTSFLLTMMLKRVLIALLTGAGNSQVAIGLYDDLTILRPCVVCLSRAEHTLEHDHIFLASALSKGCLHSCEIPEAL